jgi:hypothetical protein
MQPGFLFCTKIEKCGDCHEEKNQEWAKGEFCFIKAYIVSLLPFV